MGIASLPMYDLPEIRPALARFWEGLARHMRDAGIAGVPDALTFDRQPDALWSDPDLLFAQACGYDLTISHPGRLRPLATPCYDAPECRGPLYASVVVVRGDCAAASIADQRGSVCVINDRASHSGMNALRLLVAPESRDGRFFAEVKLSGSHAESLAMVGRGEADMAAIDCVTYALLQRYRPAALGGARKLCRTQQAPGLPFVTRASVDDDRVAAMRRAVLAAFADPDLGSVREALLLRGVVVLPDDAYGRITAFETRAAELGFPRLS